MPAGPLCDRGAGALTSVAEWKEQREELLAVAWPAADPGRET
jgi:hypothetical protein